MTAARILATLPSARLACLNVLRQGRITLDTTLDAHGHNKHLDRLVALKHWAQPLKLEEARLTVHVLEAVDPAAAILDFVEGEPRRSSPGRGAPELAAPHVARQRVRQDRRRGAVQRYRRAAAARGAGNSRHRVTIPTRRIGRARTA